ncbi:MAG: 30S ribosomal protein S6 [Candidatus Marinimicrobia bacterium]|nr:30S ribosomal protein S6 [Candidatus Neomarinimicrobiota bacterium]
MRYYESLYIVNPNYEQDRLDEVIKTITNKVGDYGFSIIHQHVWGKKRLAYSIQKHKYGTFVLLYFETGSVKNLDRFERFMVLQKPILRNQTVVLEARPEIQQDEEPVIGESVEGTTETTEKTAGEGTEEKTVGIKEVSKAFAEEEAQAEAGSIDEESSEPAEEEQAVEAEKTEKVQE